MPLTVSAPGKIHLLGEHAVVYGYPALLAAAGRRLYVGIKNSALPTGGQELKIRNKNEITIHSHFGDTLIHRSITVFQKAYAIEKLPSIEIFVTSDIPVGVGMGSSAALAAGIIGTLMKQVKNIWNPTRINELAYEVEKIAHGNPSGADNTTVVFGGLLWYRKEFDFLKSIWSLPMTQYKIPRFAFIDTGKPQESTKEMVAAVASEYTKNPKKMNDIFSEQEQLTKQLLLGLKNDKREVVKRSIRNGEENLEKIGVVGDFAQNIIRGIEGEGGVAKVCGAGGKKKGSGILLCYHENLSAVKKIAEKYSAEFFQTALGEEGIRIEQQ